MDVEPRKLVWEGAVPLQLELHPSEVTTLPPPSPFMTLAPRHGYLPLLVDYFRPHFQGVLPPGPDNIWFDYQGLPLKWHIPTGVLFDLLCLEPERPWKVTVHFRDYPSDVLTAYEGNEAAKWNFMNTLKEASYIMYGNTKSVMNLSQSDQLELWRCILKGDLEGYDHRAVRLRPPLIAGITKSFSRLSSSKGTGLDVDASTKAGLDSSFSGKIPLRIYVRALKTMTGDTFMVPPVSSWDEVVSLTRPMEISRQQGVILTLRDALVKVFPHLFTNLLELCNNERTSSNDRPHDPQSEGMEIKGSDAEKSQVISADESVPRDDTQESHSSSKFDHQNVSAPSEGLLGLSANDEFKGAIRIQGIEPSLDLPIDWIAKNLCGTDHFVHMCVFTIVPQDETHR